MLESLFNKVAGLACKVIKKRLQQMCFSVNFAKFLRKLLLQNPSGRLLRKCKEKNNLNEKNLNL